MIYYKYYMCNANPSIYFDFKIAIFDLDFTLWNGLTIFTDVHNILDTLKKNEIKCYVASFHLEAPKCCKELGIDSYFSQILFGREKTKLQMIREIRDIECASEHDMIFFDDNIYNIIDVKSGSCVRTVKITNGLDWSFVPKKYKAINQTNDTMTTFSDQIKIPMDYIYLSSSIYDIYNDDYLEDGHEMKKMSFYEWSHDFID